VADGQGASSEGLRTLFQVHCPDAANYAKVLFWSFVAGFSEKFATNIIRQLDRANRKHKNLQVSSDASIGFQLKLRQPVRALSSDCKMSILQIDPLLSPTKVYRTS